nr:MAG TPA: hypothetical protein [Caudoviricetes sp.]
MTCRAFFEKIFNNYFLPYMANIARCHDVCYNINKVGDTNGIRRRK